MSKCLYCHQKKGKRPCPALHGLICSQCCGSHRLSGIACPDDCGFLDSNLDYQQKRVGEHFEQERRKFYQELLDLGNDRATEIFYVFEALTFRFFQSRRDAQDGEVIAGIECLRRSFSPIHVPEPSPPAFGQELKKEFTVLAEQQTLDSTLATAVLDQAIKFIRQFSGEGLRSNRFLSGLIGYIRHKHPDVAEQLARQAGAGGRIIIPSGVNIEDPSSLPQQHH